ncbi:MAG: hypothetical protein JWN14_865, partial [Chthonomonadales bacterium]|nr:hypothetical protein [Chthonomonadales bacterium]
MKVQTEQNFGRLPLSFEPNQGQADQKVRFLTHTLDSALSLNASEALFTLSSSPSTPPKSSKAHRRGGKPSVGTLRMQLVGANSQASTLQQQPLEGRVNYFCDRDPHKWHSNIPTFGKVGFQGVYPGVDVVYYGNQQHLEYDFVVAPHADPKQIKLHFAGAKDVRVNAAGDLLLRAQGRELTWRKPTVYQQSASGRHAIPAHYRLKRLPNGQAGVSFALGRYDTSRPLVIDPVLIYSTRLGTNANPAGASIAADSAGNAYIANYAQVSSDLAAIVVTKLNATGTAAIYSTFFGPVAPTAPAIAVDSSGNAYIVGVGTPGYPTTVGAYKTQLPGTPTEPIDVVVTKLNPAGTAMVYSTAIGSGASTGPLSIAIDSTGNAYFAGSTIGTFPTTPGAFQTVSRSITVTGFVTKLNATGTDLVYSTLLGGKSDLQGFPPPGTADNVRGIAIDSSGNAYVTGITKSSDFPTTPGAYQTTFSLFSHYTAFVTELNPTGTALVYSTYFGGDFAEGHGIAVDSSGSAYVVGRTGSNFPTTPGAYQTSNSRAFVTKFNPTGTGLIYSAQLGVDNNDMANGIVLDSSGNAYVTGQTLSSAFPTTIGAVQRVKLPFYSNTFLSKLNASGSALIYSTFLGGTVVGDTTFNNANTGDAGQSVAIDSSGNAFVTGTTLSTDFPTTPNAYSRNYGNYFATKLSTVPIFPDFNKDGNTDLLLQNASTGAVATWFMHGTNKVGNVAFSLTPPVEYALVGAGDFSGNGNNTLVLQSSVTHKIALWYTNGTNNATISGGNFVDATPDASYKVVGVGDFNGDGKSDLVFQNQTTGQIAVWFLDGSHRYGGVLLSATPGTGWSVVGTGDFNKDGFTDLVFQNQTT